MSKQVLTIPKMCGKTRDVVLAKREKQMDNLLDAVGERKEKR